MRPTLTSRSPLKYVRYQPKAYIFFHHLTPINCPCAHWQDDSPVHETVSAKEVDSKSKGKSNGAPKNTKKESEAAKKGPAQGKTMTHSESVKSIDEAVKDSPVKSKADKNTKGGKQKGKGESGKAAEVMRNKSVRYECILSLD